MAPRIESSESGSDSEQEQLAKPKCRPADDVSGTTASSRTRDAGSRRPSQKQATNEKENLITAQQRLLAAEKKAANLRKRINKIAALEDNNPTRTEDGLESEEDDAEPPNGAFVSSITPLGRLPLPAQRSTAPPRKTNKAKSTETPAISSRAYKILPEVTHDQQQRDEDNDSAGDHMDIGDDPEFFRDAGDGGDDDVSSPSPPQPPSGTSQSGGRKRPHAAPEPSPAPLTKRSKTKLKEPKFRDGFVIVPGVKSKAGDYESFVEALLLRGMAEYSVRILTRDAFPQTVQFQWAQECFGNASLAAGQPRYLFTDRMAKLTMKRGSHIRGKVMESFRPLFESHFGFQRGNSKTIIAANKANYAALTHKASFGYKDTKARIGYGENLILAAARKHAIFKDKKSLAAIFRSYFDPLPAAYVALEFTALQHLTEEFSTGTYINASFQEKDVVQSYRTHLADIEKWMSCNPVVTEKLRRKWFKRAARNFGPAEPAADTHIDEKDEDALRKELEGRTGDTDSENEGDAEDDAPE